MVAVITEGTTAAIMATITMRHTHHHARHHSGHHSHHGWGGGGWGGYGGGWGGGWGGWGGGWGSHLGWGLAGYGLGAWGLPYGGWSSYAANQPISAPLTGTYLANNTADNVANNSTPAASALADSGAPIENPYAQAQQNGAQRPPADQLAANDAENENEEEEDNTFDYRGAIYVALPRKDAQVYLNGQLVQGEGNQRVLLTPEIDNDDDHPEKFDVRTVWNDNGHEQQRETNVEVGPGAGIAVNFTKPVDPQKPWIALYEPQYDDEEESSDEPSTAATAQEESPRTTDQQQNQAEQQGTAAPEAHRQFESARPAAN